MVQHLLLNWTLRLLGPLHPRAGLILHLDEPVDRLLPYGGALHRHHVVGLPQEDLAEIRTVLVHSREAVVGQGAGLAALIDAGGPTHRQGQGAVRGHTQGPGPGLVLFRLTPARHAARRGRGADPERGAVRGPVPTLGPFPSQRAQPGARARQGLVVGLAPRKSLVNNKNVSFCSSSTLRFEYVPRHSIYRYPIMRLHALSIPVGVIQNVY